MEKSKVLSSLKISEDSHKGVSGCEKRFVPADYPASQRDSSIPVMQSSSKGPFAPSNNGQNIKGSVVKEEKMEYCSSPCNLFHGARVNNVDQSLNWLDLDLNIAMDMRDDSSVQQTKYGPQPPQKLSREYSGKGLMLGESLLQMSNFTPRLPSSSLPVDKFNDSDISLDLQLKLPSRPEPRLNLLDPISGDLDSAIETADLSLSLGGSFSTVKCTAVKAQPDKEVIPKESKKIDPTVIPKESKKIDPSVKVKSEPCEGISHGKASNSEGPSKPTSICNGDIKSEPLEEKDSYPELDRRNIELPNDSNNRKGLDLNSECMVDLNSDDAASGLNMLHDGPRMVENASMLIDARKTQVAALNLASKARIPNTDKSHHDSVISTCFSFPEEGNGIVGELPESVTESMPSGKELNSVKESGEVDGNTSDLLSEKPVASDVNEPLPADSVSKIIDQAGVIDGNSEVAENVDKNDGSAKISDEKSFDNELEMGRPHHAVNAEDTVLHEKVGNNDGDVSALVSLHNADESSINQKEQAEEIIDSVGPVVVPISMPLQGDVVVEKHIQNTDELKNDHGDQKGAANSISENLHESATSSSGKRMPMGGTEKTKQCQPGKEGVSKMKLINTVCAKPTEKDPKKRGLRSTDPVPSKRTLPLKTNSTIEGKDKLGGTTKPTNGPSGSYKKVDPNPARPLESHVQRDWYNDRSVRLDRMNSRWHSDENLKGRFQRSKNWRENYNPQFEKRGSDWKRTERPGNWPKSAQERAFAVSSDDTPATDNFRKVGRPYQDDRRNFFRLPSRRWTSENRGVQIPADNEIGHRLTRRISPGCPGRDVPDFLVQQIEQENLMREFSDGMVDNPLLPHLRPQYERPENGFVRRGRRMLEVYDEQLEASHPESAQTTRPSNMPLPQRPCYPNEAMFGIYEPPSLPRLPEGLTDMDPGEEGVDPWQHNLFDEQTTDVEFVDHFDDQPAFDVENGSARSFEFRPEARAVFPDRVNARNIRNRLGDASNGHRVVDRQGGNYRFNGKKRWHAAQFEKARTKRRY